MLQVARLAPTLLQEATDPVAEFFLSRFNDDGAATDRAGHSDLYYTVFALEGLIALQRELPPRVRLFLERIGDGADLDLVHLCCLARCWAALKQPAPDLAGRIDALWDRDSVYHSFLAWGALQDLGRQPKPFPFRDGSLATTTPTTAAGVTLLRQMQSPVPQVWWRREFPSLPPEHYCHARLRQRAWHSQEHQRRRRVLGKSRREGIGPFLPWPRRLFFRMPRSRRPSRK